MAKTKQCPVVKKEIKQVIKYMSPTDGKLFDTEEEAKQHEAFITNPEYEKTMRELELTKAMNKAFGERREERSPWFPKIWYGGK